MYFSADNTSFCTRIFKNWRSNNNKEPARVAIYGKSIDCHLVVFLVVIIYNMESMLYLLYLQLLFASLIVHSFVGGAPTIIDIDPTSIQDDTVKHKKHTNDKTYSHQSRSLHESHILKMKHNLRNMILDDLNERRRSIEEGDWMFINEYLDNINLNITINETFDFLGIDFELVSLTCDELRISDIDTEGSASTQYDLGFSISGISLSCVLNYR